MGYVEIKDFWDVISYKGNSAGTPVTRSARVFLNIHTCMYFWAQEQRTKGIERFATIATPPPPPPAQVTSMCGILTHLVLFLYFQSSKKSLLMKNKHTKLISVSKTRLNSLFSLVRMVFFVVENEKHLFDQRFRGSKYYS